MANQEGPVSVHVTDATKYQCPRCGSSRIQLRFTYLDPNLITDDETFAALLITFASGTSAQGIVALCHCGKEWVPFWYVFDVGASNGTAITMTNLVQATTANLLADYYLIYLGTNATDKGKYFTIASNTAADPTVITPDGSLHADTDGMFALTNILPLGFTLAT